jgi:hypothetical protein
MTRLLLGLLLVLTACAAADSTVLTREQRIVLIATLDAAKAPTLQGIVDADARRRMTQELAGLRRALERAKAPALIAQVGRVRRLDPGTDPGLAMVLREAERAATQSMQHQPSNSN